MDRIPATGSGLDRNGTGTGPLHTFASEAGRPMALSASGSG